MNYIKHLTGFFHRISSDSRLNPTHVSLYMALFQFWNANHFSNPVSISRQELMKISKISAKATYHKCINDLHSFGYIRYEPSNNPFKGSLVYLSAFQTGSRLVAVSDRTKIETGTEQALVPYINNTNNSNNTEENYDNGTGSKNDTKQKGRAAIPPPLKEVQDYFTEQKSSVTEADKFYNYFQSNGWKVGGKAPMKDWQASARNWMINAVKFSQSINSGRSQNPPKADPATAKDYSEPL